ncbi:response regulator [Lujinxingia vulgaris]|uniref:histidine kinase n=1 Tax=Lujinxingia vulgaris TaxID=2600176 RepID=A0A5C6XBY7_9DELT|nr:hybrid sensor histidine kinase/response regulator [Lujinxingia vulgaris]TXD39406.1 response regulator [Lujinxingia vulgaris]
MTSFTGAQSRGTFLVVDDEPDILDAIARLFRKEYTVLTAQSVEEALKLIAAHDVQVVMTDQRMPKMSGIEFLAELREDHPEIVRVLFTGYSNISDVIDAINEGHVYRYISKPWKPVELRLFVAQAFEYYRAQRERRELMAQLREANEQLEEQNALLSAANEELKLLDRVKNVFMEVVSHELNTPIAIVFGYTFLLRKELGEDLSSVASKALSGIDSSAVRLKNISNRIFKMLGDDGSGEALDLEWVDVRKFVDSLQDQLDPFLQKRNQRLETVVAPEAQSILADEDKLNDMCLNLLMNAIKFSYDDQVITLDIGLSDDPEVLALTVRDSGVGISDDDIAQIFDVFFSTFNTGHHSSGQFEFNKRGIGLGLAVAKRFAEMHGGYIKVDSEEGRGSLFTVYLPVRPEQQTLRSSVQTRQLAQHAPH